MFQNRDVNVEEIDNTALQTMENVLSPTLYDFPLERVESAHSASPLYRLSKAWSHWRPINRALIYLGIIYRCPLVLFSIQQKKFDSLRWRGGQLESWPRIFFMGSTNACPF